LTKVILATRRSSLAMAQAREAARCLQNALPEHQAKLLPLVTTGDQRLNWSLENAEVKGLFTREIDHALLSGKADLAVHSAKDLPVEIPEGLETVGYLPREAPWDVMVYRSEWDPQGKTGLAATNSPRRREQLSLLYPGLQWTTLRGNVETRLKKVLSGEADLTMLARAGLNRLGIHAREGLVFRQLGRDEMLPAAGQGAIALQCRLGEAERFVSMIDPETTHHVQREKLTLALLGGGCHSASTAFSDEEGLHLWHPEGGRITFKHLPDKTEIQEWLKR